MSSLLAVPAPQAGDALAEHEVREKNVVGPVRHAVLERDQNQCRSCGQGGDGRLHLHHVTFRSQGGGDTRENLVTLCLECHDDVHKGLLIPSYIEWRAGEWEWFFARYVWPRRWAKRTSGRRITSRT